MDDNDGCAAVHGEVPLVSNKNASRQILYKKHVTCNAKLFRAHKDYQYEEKPHQLFTSLVFISCLLVLSYLNEAGIVAYNEGMEAEAQIGQQFAAQERQLAIHPRAAETIRLALLGVAGGVTFYCFLQSKDGLFTRPHPGVWRAVHGLGLVYLISLLFLFILPASLGRQLLQQLFPNVRTAASNLQLDQAAEEVFAGTLEIDCAINRWTILRQLRTPWFTSHILGWFVKMCMFRSWSFCLCFSISFELFELSFQWLIPEMKECWWDSLILDVGVSNMIGMLGGAYALKLLNSHYFDWVAGDAYASSNTIRKKYIYTFLPFTWSKYDWKFFDSPIKLLHSLFMLFIANVTELNAFFLMYALDIRATHTINICRCILVCLLSLHSVAEHYEYVEGNLQRVGNNVHLFGCIFIMEVLIVSKYGKSRFKQLRIPPDVLLPWSVGLLQFGLWCFFHFKKLKRTSRYKSIAPDKATFTSPLASTELKLKKFTSSTDDAADITESKEIRTAGSATPTGSLGTTASVNEMREPYFLSNAFLLFPAFTMFYPLLYLLKFYHY